MTSDNRVDCGAIIKLVVRVLRPSDSVSRRLFGGEDTSRSLVNFFFRICICFRLWTIRDPTEKVREKRNTFGRRNVVTTCINLGCLLMRANRGNQTHSKLKLICGSNRDGCDRFW